MVSKVGVRGGDRRPAARFVSMFLVVQRHVECPRLSRIVDKGWASSRITISAEVAELADALRSGRSELYAHVGSNPTFGTRSPLEGLFSVMGNLRFPFEEAGNT